jgi:hypothetical protein
MNQLILNTIVIFLIFSIAISLISNAYSYASLSVVTLFSYNFTTLTSVPSTIVPTNKYVKLAVNSSGLFISNGTAQIGLPYPTVVNITAVNGKIFLGPLTVVQNSSGVYIYNNNVLVNKTSTSTSIGILEMGGKIIIGVYGTKVYYQTAGQYGVLQMQGQFKSLTVYEQQIQGAAASQSVVGSGSTLVNAGTFTAYSNQFYIQLTLSTPVNVTIILIDNRGQIKPLVNSTVYAPFILPNGSTVRLPVVTVAGNNINVIGSGIVTSTQSYQILVGLPAGQTATLQYGQALDVVIGPSGIAITSSSSSSSTSNNMLYYAIIGFVFLVFVILVIAFVSTRK